MNALLAALPDFDITIALCYLRLQAFFLILPGIGERYLPPRVKVALAMALTPLLHEVARTPFAPASPLDLLAPGLAEMAAGFVIGALVRLLAMALDVATAAMASATSLSQLVGGANEASPHPIGNLLHLGGLAVLFTLGLPILAADLLAQSYALWPLGALPQAADIAPAAIDVVARSFGMAMVLAAPFVLGGFLFQALSGVVNKVMPALPVIFIGAPASILLALVSLAALSPLLVGLWADAVLSMSLPVPR